MFLIILLVGFIIVSFCYAFASMVASVGNTLTGNSKASQADRYEAERIKLEALRAELHDMEQRLDKLKPPRRKLPG